jgi:enoyl-CoA hydratase/carnithine racemase
MLAALGEAVDTLANDELIRAVVLRASGKAFCAARFAVSGINVGLFCATPGVALSRNVPRKAAFEMLVTGEFVSAEEARVLGLVNRVAAPEALDDEVEALVARIVAKPGVAVAMGKALFYRQIEVGIESAYADAGATMACNMMDPSALEGVAAFIEKRPPSWVAAQGAR